MSQQVYQILQGVGCNAFKTCFLWAISNKVLAQPKHKHLLVLSHVFSMTWLDTGWACFFLFQVFGMMSATRFQNGSPSNDKDHYRGLMVTGVRMATCNQILDPWVYILLRRAILRKIYRITKKQASFRGSTFRSARWEVSSFQNSEKTNVNKV